MFGAAHRADLMITPVRVDYREISRWVIEKKIILLRIFHLALID